MKLLKYLIILVVLPTGCFTGEELEPDQEIWEYAFPDDAGMSNDLLLEVNSGITAGSFQTVRSMIIIKDDKLIFENYYNGDTRGTIRPIGRSSPMVTVLALGIAIEEGLIGGVNVLIRDVLPIQYDDIFASNPLKRRITIEHLLLFESGLSWNEGVLNLNDPANDVNAVKFSDDWVRFVLEKPLEAEPGIRFNFNSMSATVIAKIIEESANMPFEEYVETKLFNKIGVVNYTWEEDPTGSINAGTGLEINTLDLTKIGYLYLKEGLWQGERIVSEAWIESAVTLRKEVTNTINYGYGWHLFADQLNFPKLSPNDTYFFPQHVFVSPSENLLVTLSGDNINLPTFGPPLLLYSEVITPLLQ
ncbi:MAG: serine hydrolase [Bacteroidota bacterium]